MKKIVKFVLIISFVLTNSLVFSQQPCNCKCGFIDTQKLLAQMPETEAAKLALEKETKALQDQLEIMQVEYNNKLQTYLENDKMEKANAAKWSEIIRQDKEAELQGLNQRIGEFQNTAQQTLQTKRGELYEPILKKVDDAIKKVSKDGAYVTVYDTNAVLYVSATLCTDITPDVKKILNLK